MGHEVEVQAAAMIYGQDPRAYRAREAKAMRAGYGGIFAHVPEAALVEAMEMCSAEAAQWVRKRRAWLARWK